MTRRQAGTATIFVVNKGKATHYLAITGPGLTGLRTAKVAPGGTATLKVKLKMGVYRLSDPPALGGRVRWINVRPTSVAPRNNGSTVQPPDGWWNMCSDI